MKNILMLENEEIVLVDSKTGKGVYSIKYVNDELSVKKVNIGVKVLPILKIEDFQFYQMNSMNHIIKLWMQYIVQLRVTLIIYVKIQ